MSIKKLLRSILGLVSYQKTLPVFQYTPLTVFGSPDELELAQETGATVST